jgi:periplasmic divalent cation tolerance protein
MNSEYVVALITAPSEEVAKSITDKLLQEKLAACVNIVSPVSSFYIWEGKINNDSEVLLVCKTRADLFQNEFIPAVKSVHPYDVPEIIALPILMASQSYLDWIKEVTKP